MLPFGNLLAVNESTWRFALRQYEHDMLFCLCSKISDTSRE